MNRLWFGVGLVAVLAAGAWFWFRSNEPPEVVVGVAEQARLDLDFTSEAFVVGKTYDVSPEMAGRVVLIHAKEGERVTAGQTLLLIDDTDLQSELSQARASRSTIVSLISEARSAYRAAMATASSARLKSLAQIRKAEAELRRVQRGTRPEVIEQARHELERLRLIEAEAKRKLERAESLYQQDVISRAARDSARLECESARTEVSRAEDALRDLERGPLIEEVDSAKAALEMAKAEYRQALDMDQDVKTRLAQLDTARSRLREADSQFLRIQALLNKAVMRSPVAGVVIRRFVEPGSMGNPASVAIRIATREDLHVEAEIRSEDLESAKQGSIVEISLPSRTGKSANGVIEQLSPAAEPKPDAAIRTRIVRARIRILGDPALFVPGMEVDVRGSTTQASTLAVPNDAVTVSQGEATVFLVIEDRVQVRSVTMGRTTVDRTEILNGLRQGDQVVIRGKENLREGSRVRVTHDRI